MPKIKTKSGTMFKNQPYTSTSNRMKEPYTVHEIAEIIETTVDVARDSKGHGVESALDDLLTLVNDLYEHKDTELKLLN